jgi:PST family polysaccharide transporter
MGGAQVVVLAAAFIRAKVIALLLGATGVGLIGIFNAFSGNVSSFAGWGLGTSGVRLIAGADEKDKPAKVAAVRRFGWTLSLLGLAAALIAFWPVAQVTFASGQYATEMAIVALAVPCIIASSMWSAIVQASGRIASLAKVQVVGALAGLLLGLPAIYFWGTKGIALSLFLAAAVPALVLWRTAHAACPPQAIVHVDRADLRQLAKIGGALMVVGWLAQLSAYLVRLVIVRHAGLEAAGYYQAAYALAGSLPGFVFAAMSADFFPRISAAKDEAEAADIAEKQIQAGLLLALPLLAVLLTMGGLCVRLLYADSFEGALPLLPWMIWGVFFRLLAWPLGYWLLGRGSGRVVIIVELTANLIGTLLPVLLLPVFGLAGSAIAFFANYVIYTVIMVCVARSRSGRWLGGRTLGAFAIAGAVLGLAQFATAGLGSPYWGLVPSALIAAGSAWAYRRALSRP